MYTNCIMSTIVGMRLDAANKVPRVKGWCSGLWVRLIGNIWADGKKESHSGESQNENGGVQLLSLPDQGASKWENQVQEGRGQ